MTEKAELTVVLLHQVELNQPFYCSPLEKRAWTKRCPAGRLSSRFDSLPVERGGVQSTMNGVAHVWVYVQNT
jgi:hypothetical protein